jgi:predicted MFS family arabinose efflux permease
VIAVAALSVAIGAAPAIVFVLGGVVAVVSTAFEPAKNALVPSLAREPEQLTAANVVTSGLESSSIFLGPALGGLLVALTSVETTFVVTAALLLLSAVTLARIHEPAREPDAQGREKDESVRDEVLGGARAIRGDRRLGLVVGLTSAQVLVDGALAVFTVVLALEILDIGEAGVGLLSAVIGVGGLIGTVFTLAVTGRRGLAGAFGLGIAAWGAPLVLIGLVPVTAVAVVALLVVGVANTLVDANGLTLIQRIAPDRVLGRVMGSLETLFLAGAALGLVGAPALIELLGDEGALIATGLFLPALALASAAALRRIDAGFAAPGPELELLRGIPIFTPLPEATIERLAGRLRHQRLSAGASVMRQGDPADGFYVIADGEVEVFEDGIPVRVQGSGEGFGEIALIRQTPRTATVTALTDVELLRLEGDDFVAAVTGHAQSEAATEAVIATRLGSARASAALA